MTLSRILASTLVLGALSAFAPLTYAAKTCELSIEGTDAMQYTLAYNYNLSKRTKVYTFYTKVNNKDNAGYNVTNLGTDFSSFALGVRHNF